MQTFLPFFRPPTRAAIRLAASTLAASILLMGCASKNPLIDGPALASAPAAATATTTATTATAAPSSKASPVAAPTTTAAQNASAATANAGLQRTTQTTARRFLGVFSPYRVDIPQGNFVTEEMLAQLKEGMTRDQVKFVLGTPLIADIFHADRWDYAFRMLKRNDEVLSSRVTVFFTDGKVSRFEGGNLPTEADYLAIIAGAAPKKTIEAAAKAAAAPSAAKPTQ